MSRWCGLGGEPFGDGEPVEAGELDVDEHDVRMKSGSLCQRHATVGGRPHDVVAVERRSALAASRNPS